MTNRVRSSLGFEDDTDAPSPADALKNFDPQAYTAPKTRPSNDRPDKAAVREAGKLAGFVSREGDKPAAPVRRRRNFSGRSEQVNIKATPDYKARFQALAAKQNWTDAVTFEKAIELLEKHCI